MRKIVLTVTALTIAFAMTVGFTNCGQLKSRAPASILASASPPPPPDCNKTRDLWTQNRFKGLNGNAATTFPSKIHINDAGEIFLVVNASDAGNANSEITVKRSFDGGVSWKSFTVVPPSAGNNFAGLQELGGALYISATVAAGGTRHWMIYRSGDKGETWVPVDDYQGNATERRTYPGGMVRDAQGAIYVAGSATISGRDTWIIRKSATGSAGSWTTVDMFAGTGGATESRGLNMTVGPDGALYAIGYVRDGTYRSVIRKSTNNGAAWTTLDTYQVATAKDTYGYTIKFVNGALYMGAAGQDAAGLYHWILRRSFNNGTNWAMADDLSGLPAGYFGPQDLIEDQAGRIFVPGLAGRVRRSSDGGTTWSNIALPQANMQINSAAVDAKGNIFLSGYDGAFGAVMNYKVSYPAKLSESCLKLATQFKPKYPLWTDGADKHRWILLPDGGKIDNSDMSNWKFPTGTQIWKEFGRDGKPVETRLFMKTGSGNGMDNWQWVTYKWNIDGTDADLFFPGEKNANGTQHDIVPANRCVNCHAGASDFALGLDALQMSGNNMLSLNSNFFTNPTNQLYEIQGNAEAKAALGYVHGNCAHCHNPDGIAKGLNLNFRHNLNATSLQTENFYLATVNKNNLNGVPYIQPGAPYASLIRNRMSVRTPTGALTLAPGSSPAITVRQMPQLGSDEIDTTGLLTIEAWISGL